MRPHLLRKTGGRGKVDLFLPVEAADQREAAGMGLPVAPQHDSRSPSEVSRQHHRQDGIL